MMKCRFCQHNSLRLIFPSTLESSTKKASTFACTNNTFGLHGPIVRCQHCGIVYVNEKISQQQISTYYEVADDPLYFAEQPAREKTFKKYLVKLEKIYPSKGKLLDVGTNTGLFVKLAQDSGWQSWGLEPNRWAVEYAAKNYQINLINKPFDIDIFKNEKFNVITMWDVIEHFTDPVAEMKKVFKLLKTGGLFAFSTIDPDSLFAKAMGTKWSWYMEMHRVFFNQKCAKYYLEKCGFKKILFKPHFRSLSIGYLTSRSAAINPKFSHLGGKLVSSLGISKTIVPYYANDLYDCYAFK